MVWTAPYGIECARMRLSETHSWEPSVSQIIRGGMDTSKHIFQLHGVDASEQVVLRKRVGRKAMLAFLAKLPPTVIAIEACGAAHHLARELGKLGHTVKLIAPQLVKPYVPRSKNDGRDAEGLCEAASRPRMRFVPVKTIEQQAALMLLGVRDQLVARRTQLSNTIPGYAAGFGLIEAKGRGRGPRWLLELLERKAPKLAAVALANKMARIAWKLMTTGEDYDSARIDAAVAAAA